MTRSELDKVVHDTAIKVAEDVARIMEKRNSSRDGSSFTLEETYASIMNACQLFTVEVVSEVLAQVLPVTD